ncbi:MAG: O-antigen ligase family protein [Gemmataceae bacterium]
MTPAPAGVRLRRHSPRGWHIGDRPAALAVAASTVIMAYGAVLGPAAIVAFYALWLPLAVRAGVPAVKLDRRTAPPLLFAAWCLLSAVWSDHPARSLYAAAEYASLVGCGLVMGVRTSPRGFLTGLALGCGAALLVALASGRYGTDPFTGEYALVGLFGSKNVIGLLAEILVLAALLAPPGRRPAAGAAARLAACGLGLGCLYLSRSATSVLSLAAAVAALAVLYGVARLPRRARLVALALAAAWAAALGAAGHLLDWEQAVLRAFGKSTTLTGRTVLWETGVAAGLDRPLGGHGFAAFWVPGNLPAEHLWYRFGIYTRTGFHFHNLFVQTFVDLGLVGAAAAVLLLAGTLLRATGLALRHGPAPGYAAAFAFAVMFGVRGFAEVDIVGSYGVGAMLFFALPPRLVRPGPPAPPEGGGRVASPAGP